MNLSHVSVWIGALTLAACAHHEEPRTVVNAPRPTKNTVLVYASSEPALVSEDAALSTPASPDAPMVSVPTRVAEGRGTNVAAEANASVPPPDSSRDFLSGPSMVRSSELGAAPAAGTPKPAREDGSLGFADTNPNTDLQVAQDIRKALLADKTLSIIARNTKVVAVGGRVTLSGTVRSARERDAVRAAADRVAGSTNVENQLEIK